MERIEDKIRRHLAINLNIISDDLQLIEEEYYLNNSNGASAKIDILAKDYDNNYVVIEIKRSDQAARQALHEIAKYTALLKHELFVKDSEIRLIIVSTTWHELLVPFSQVKKNSIHYLEGYQISVDDNNIPITAEKIIPIDVEHKREFSRYQSFFLYKNNQRMQENRKNLEEYALKSGFSNYVILEIHTNDDIPYPVALYFAHQKMDENFYLKILNNIDKEANNECSYYDEAIELKESLEYDIDEYINYLEEMASVDIVNKMKCDSYEIGYPEKISQALEKNWTVDNMHRYGIFKKDKRISDNDLIIELCGLNGISIFNYYNQCLSKYKAKIIEIKEDIRRSLYLNEDWEEQIDAIFNEILKEEKEFRINVLVFNPEDIFGVIASMKIKDFADCVPQYKIIIEYLNEDTIKIFYGIIDWVSEGIGYNEIMRRYFYGNEFNYFVFKQLNGICEIDHKMMYDMGLKYSSKVLILSNGEETDYDIIFKRKSLELTEVIDKKHFDDYLINNQDIVFAIWDLYQKYVIGYPERF